jgi:hypothetical protein
VVRIPLIITAYANNGRICFDGQIGSFALSIITNQMQGAMLITTGKITLIDWQQKICTKKAEGLLSPSRINIPDAAKTLRMVYQFSKFPSADSYV